MNRVDRLLMKVTAALDAADIPYAVIGGNAVAAWVATREVGAVRATKAVDLLLRRDDLDRMEVSLSEIGLLRDEVMGIPVFMESDNLLPSQGVHIVLANEKVRANSPRPAPDVTRSFRSASGFLVLELDALLAMKLEANRRHDQVHMEDLLRVGLIDADLASKLPADLLERLRYVRDTMEWFTEPPKF